MMGSEGDPTPLALEARRRGSEGSRCVCICRDRVRNLNPTDSTRSCPWLCLQGRTERKKEKAQEEGSDLGSFTLDAIQHGLVRGFAETAVETGLGVLITLIPGTESLGAIVEGVSEGLVNTGDGIPACHEDLAALISKKLN